VSARSLGPLARDAVVARARKAIGHATVYKLGQGGRDPLAQHPGAVLTVEGFTQYLCDCSGFAAWCVGVDRYLPNVGGDAAEAYQWFETSNLAKDVEREDWPNLSKVLWQAALPGDLLVWGDRNGSQGHVGVVASLGQTGPETVVHCSMGNFRREKDAIRETGVELFLRNHALVAHVAWVGA